MPSRVSLLVLAVGFVLAASIGVVGSEAALRAAPSPPTNLTASAISASTATIMWTASVRGSVSSYLVRLDGKTAGSTAETAYSLGSLSCAKKHTVNVAAVTAAGAKSSWANLSFMTASCPVAPPPVVVPPPSLQPPLACLSCWHPPVKTTWQIQFAGTIDTTVSAQLFDIDYEDNSAATVSALHQAGRKVACYIDAGSYESYRGDAASFPASLLGNTVGGWPDERWLDIRQLSVLEPIIAKRMDTCAAKGFDGIDFDLVQEYLEPGTGFTLTAGDQLAYDTWLANAAHARNLFVLLKNDLDQIDQLLPYFDGELNEQCFEYNECSPLSKFIQAGKPVFETEYSLATTAFCPAANAAGFNAMLKHVSLDAWRAPCW